MKKMPLKYAPSVLWGVIRALIYSVEGSRSQRKKINFFSLDILAECKHMAKSPIIG